MFCKRIERFFTIRTGERQCNGVGMHFNEKYRYIRIAESSKDLENPARSAIAYANFYNCMSDIAHDFERVNSALSLKRDINRGSHFSCLRRCRHLLLELRIEPAATLRAGTFA